MWDYPEFDPVALSIGFLNIHWYALAYLVGIGLVWWTTQMRIKRDRLDWTSNQFTDLLFYCIWGVILGGRLGYMVFYGHSQLLADPLALFRIWEGGMSFHGGFIGVMVGALVYGHFHKRSFFAMLDLIAPSIPLALGAGRLGNFINMELPGRVTDLSWAVIFPGETQGRHPSSLYQALLEGPLLFAFLWWFATGARRPGEVSAAFLMGYGSLRLFSEFFREPDAHLGFIMLGWVTAGQLLSLPMIMIGAWLFYNISKNGQASASSNSGCP